MRIGIDVRPLQTAHRGAGIGTYTFNLVKHLLRLEGPEEWLLYVLRNRSIDTDLSLPRRLQVRRPRRSAHAALWEQILLPFDVARGRLDVFHATGGLTQVWEIGAPYVQPCRTVITVQDLHPLVLPHFRFIAGARMFRWQTRALRKAAAVIAVSHNTRSDIMRLLGIPGERIEVIPMAPGEHFHVMEDAEVLAVLARYSLTPPFVLYVGNYNVHKNIETLLEAWARTRPIAPLVIVGKRETYPSSFLDRIAALGRSEAVRFTGGLRHDSRELVALYNAASVFAFPSLYEGFGLPVVEAMKCGCPVIASRRGSLPEVAGEAGVLVEPEDVTAWTEEIQRGLDDSAWRETLRARGLKHVERFDWRRTAQRTREVYRKAADHGG